MTISRSTPTTAAEETPVETVHVAVGVILNAQDEVLLAKRHDEQHQGGLWEFPGGKVEADEGVMEALRRELREEVAIELQSARQLINVSHDYGDRQVCLDVWYSSDFSGKPEGCQGQPVCWVAIDELQRYAFPAANMPILQALRELAHPVG